MIGCDEYIGENADRQNRSHTKDAAAMQHHKHCEVYKQKACSGITI